MYVGQQLQCVGVFFQLGVVFWQQQQWVFDLGQLWVVGCQGQSWVVVGVCYVWELVDIYISWYDLQVVFWYCWVVVLYVGVYGVGDVDYVFVIGYYCVVVVG